MSNYIDWYFNKKNPCFPAALHENICTKRRRKTLSEDDIKQYQQYYDNKEYWLYFEFVIVKKYFAKGWNLAEIKLLHALQKVQKKFFSTWSYKEYYTENKIKKLLKKNNSNFIQEWSLASVLLVCSNLFLFYIHKTLLQPPLLGLFCVVILRQLLQFYSSF